MGGVVFQEGQDLDSSRRCRATELEGIILAIGTPNLGEAVQKARDRADELSTGLQTLADRVRGAHPDTVASEDQKRARRRFLESLYDEEGEAQQAFERIIGGNELQDANFLPRGTLVARTVVRVVIRAGGGRVLGYGTGVLAGNGVLLTNNHVLPNSDVARASYAEAYYERGIEGEEARTLEFALEPDRLWFTSKDLDFSIVGIAETDRHAGGKLEEIGWIPLIGTTGKVVEGEWLTIIQHPRGERKQLCVRENQLLKCDNDVLWYSTDTLGGSSGSPVFNNDWQMVALHHSGVPETKDGKWQTVDGRDYDPNRDDETRIKWIANEGIRVSRILATLRSDNSIANHPLVDPLLKLDVGDLQVRVPVLTAAGAPPKVDLRPALPPASPKPSEPTPRREASMTRRSITVTLEVDDDGTVSIAGGDSEEAAFLEAARVRKPKNIIEAPVDPKRDWVGGYDPWFLDPKKAKPDLEVPLPVVVQKGKIAPLNDAYGQTFTAAERAEGVLKYKGYSVVMNKDRRFAFYSAANVDGGMRPAISGRNDVWMFDDRISRDHQVDNSFYKEVGGRKNRFDRGHLTRRDDMEWGKDPVDAVNRANGTCTWPNCSAQHEIFNQGKDKNVLLWQNLERYILEQTAAANQFRVQVITGQIFGAADPVFRGIAYPLEFWKVVVAVTSKGKLFATGYILGQKETIDKFGIEEAALEVPFGEFGTYQRPLSVIENVAGLNFTYGAGKPLSDVDPLAKAGWRPRRRRRAGTGEAFGVGGGDDALESFDDIILE